MRLTAPPQSQPGQLFASGRHDLAEQAHTFINFLLEPEVIAEVSDYVGYANPNTKADEFMDEEVRNDPSIYPSQAVLDKLYISSTPSPKIMRVMTRSWSKIKSNR